MSRLKNFPAEISVGMKADGELIILPEKANWGIFIREEIKKVETYSLPPVSVVPKRQRRRSSNKTSPKNPQAPPPQQIVSQPEQENSESTEEAMFHCNACGKDVDNPKTAGNGKTQCPYCLVIGKVVGKEI